MDSYANDDGPSPARAPAASADADSAPGFDATAHGVGTTQDGVVLAPLGSPATSPLASALPRPPRPPVPLRRQGRTDDAAAAAEAEEAACIDFLLGDTNTIADGGGGAAAASSAQDAARTVYVDGRVTRHAGTLRADQELWPAIERKLGDPLFSFTDLSATEMRILRGRAALLRAQAERELETEFRAEQTRPRLRAAPPPPPHTASRRKRAPLSPPSSVRAGGAGAGTSNSVADLAAALHGLDRIKRRRHALLRSRDRLDAEVQTLREQMLRPGIARAEKERLAGGVARASVESDKLRARLESPGMAQLAKEERRLRALAAAGGGGGAVAAAVAPLSEGKRAEQLAALLAEGEEEEGGDGAERLPRLLDVDGDGFVSAGDLRHALDAATPGQVWTERHALRLLASALGGGGGGGGGTDGATYPQLAAAADSVTAALRAAVRRGATLRDAQAKARLLAGAAERRRRRCAALEAEAAAARRAAAEAGREVAATAAGADGAVALPRLVRKRDAALGRLRAAEEGLRAAEAAAPEAVLTPREEGLLRDQRCGRVQVRLEREREAAACPFAQAPKTCEAVRARTARHRAQRTLRLERWRAAHPSLCAHDAASAPSHHPGTPTARPPSCPRSPSASSAQAGSAVRRCPPRRAPPAAVQVYSLEHPALQGVYVYDAAFEERGGGGGEEDGEGGGMRWIRSADGARIEFADATGVWEMWAGAGAAGAASKGLRSRSGDVVLGAVEWEGCAETTVVELPSRVRGGGKRDKSRVAGSLKGCGGGGGSGNPWHAVYASHPTTSSAFRACPPPQRRREGGRGGDEGGGGGDALHSALTSAHARGSMGVNTYEALRTYSPPYAPFS